MKKIYYYINNGKFVLGYLNFINLKINISGLFFLKNLIFTYQIPYDFTINESSSLRILLSICSHFN